MVLQLWETLDTNGWEHGSNIRSDNRLVVVEYKVTRVYNHAEFKLISKFKVV